jgi:hypothetical protein
MPIGVTVVRAKMTFSDQSGVVAVFAQNFGDRPFVFRERDPVSPLTVCAWVPAREQAPMGWSTQRMGAVGALEGDSRFRHRLMFGVSTTPLL